MITPFIDPITREKLHFNEEVSKYVPKQQLWTELGGDVNFEYDHAQYWPALTALSKERSNERKARWEAAGKNIGESEVYMRGGNAPSVSTVAAPQAAIAVPAKVDGSADIPAVVGAPAAPVAESVIAPAGIENQKPI